MSLSNPKSGFFNASEFQSSGLPWVISATASSAIVKHEFPNVTKDITIINSNIDAAQKLRIGFTENGVNEIGGKYYILLNGGSSITLNVRIKEIYLLRDSSTDISISICANLTTIHSSMMPALTGSINGSACWEGVG